MNQSIRNILVVVVLSLGIHASAFAGNIVVNPDFEGTTYLGPSGPGGPDVLPTGWILGPPATPDSTNVNVVSAVNPAIDEGPESGTNYVAFMSQATSGKDCLYQYLDTVAGQEYDFTFWVGFTGSNAGNEGQSGMDVVWDETGADTILDGMNGGLAYAFPTNAGPVAYQEFSYLVTASSTTTRIDFHGVEDSGAILLDNVSVEAVGAPEPVSMLLTGIGLLLVAMALKARNRSASRRRV